MHIFNSPSSIRKIITLLLVWSVFSFAFAQEDSSDCEANRGFLEYREIPESKKGTVVFSEPSESPKRVIASKPRSIRLSDRQNKARTYRNLGWKFQGIGDLNRALKLYKKAVALDHTYAAAYNDLGVIYELKGQLDLAEENYLRSANEDPHYLNAYSNLALLYEQKEQYDKAVFYWKRRLELGCTGDPWTEKAKRHLQDIRRASQGRVDMSDADEQKILGLIEDALQQAEMLQ